MHQATARPHPISTRTPSHSELGEVWCFQLEINGSFIGIKNFFRAKGFAFNVFLKQQVGA